MASRTGRERSPARGSSGLEDIEVTLLLEGSGDSWQASDWSKDGFRLLLIKYVSINESYPFVFDVGRADNPHVTFGGGGPHHCLGAMLARAEIRAALDELLLRADDISLGAPKVTHPNLANNMSIFDEMAISLRPR